MDTFVCSYFVCIVQEYALEGSFAGCAHYNIDYSFCGSDLFVSDTAMDRTYASGQFRESVIRLYRNSKWLSWG